MNLNERIIIALDFDKLTSAKDMVDRLDDAVFFKVGLQAFLAFGDEIIEYLKEKNKRVFLDLKFKDIPNTVEGAIKSVLKYNPNFLTIHTSGGAEMIRRSIETARQNQNLTVLGVTVLTSLGDNDLLEQGISLDTEKTVLKLAEIGIRNGMDSFVCSPKEIRILKSKFKDDIVLVTPGIRPSWSEKGDQKRVFTPRMAVEHGCDYMVIGRPITKHPDPNRAFNMILEEIGE